MPTDALGNSETARRRELWALRNVMKDVSRRKVLRGCGNVLGRAVAVQKLATGEGAFGGLESCSSVWCCPVCASKIVAERQAELEALVSKAQAENLFVSMLTLTQRHHAGQKLQDLWAALSKAWTFAFHGEPYKIFKEQTGFVGYVRAVEVTHGKNGWHVHTHALFITKRDPNSVLLPVGRGKFKKLLKPVEYIAQRWKRKLSDLGIDFLSNPGADFVVAKEGSEKVLGKYVAKAFSNISKELSLGSFKRARDENRTPFQILHDIQEFGDADDIDLWREWEKVSTNKRQLLWSQGLKDWAGINEKTDEEIINQQTERETYGFITRKDWIYLLRSGIGADLLDLSIPDIMCIIAKLGIIWYEDLDEVPKIEDQ